MGIGQTHLCTEAVGKFLYVNLLQQVIDTLCTHLGNELCRIVVRKVVVVRVLVENCQILVLGKEFEFLPVCLSRTDDNVLLVVDYRLEFLGRNAENSGNLVRS